MMTIRKQKLYAFWFGVVFIILLFLSFILIFFLEIYKIPSLLQLFEFFFRVVLAASLAGVAAMIPGYFDIEWSDKLGIRAGGAFAVFLLIFMVNPPRIITDYSETAKTSDLFIGCDQLKGGTEPNADTEAYCTELYASFPEHWKAQLAMAKLMSVKKKPDESLTFALNAMSAFYAMTGESIFDTLNNQNNPNFHDAKKILHTLRNVSWGSGSFGFANHLLEPATVSGVISVEEASFERKFNSGQAIIRHIFSTPTENLTQTYKTDFDYEIFYDSCLLSWQYIITQNEYLKNRSIEKYKLAKERIWKRDGTNAATQRIHFECLENNADDFGINCGQSIGVPQYCPIFSILSK